VLYFTDGRWVLYGTMGGGSVEGGLFAHMLRKRVTITATTLRSRTDEYKTLLTRQFASEILPVLAAGILKPIIDKEFELKDIQAAHDYMESNASVGKIVIKVA
jgi:tumor protein p53-inducible protein 3